MTNRICVLVTAALLTFTGCGEDSPGDGTDGGGGGMDAAAGADAGTGTDDGGSTGVDADGLDGAFRPGDGSAGCVVVSCGTRTTECGDCEDNDGDGLLDSSDPECLGPCDNTEGEILLAGVGGETGGPCASDCYFDFGNGSGNDDCFWDHRCDPLSTAPRFDPEGDRCPFEMDRVGTSDCPDTQSEQCLNFCRPLTPNGCDCFGCCTFDAIADRPAAEGGAYVWLGSVVDGTNDGTCTLDDVTDIDACRPCTPVEACNNPCGRCELCVGRDRIPDDCTPPPPPGTDAGMLPDGGTPPEYRCDPGVQECGLPGDAPCPTDFYCVTGCCVPTIF